MRFDVLEPYRTSTYFTLHSSNYILTEIARYIDFFCMSSGWFDWTEPSVPTSLQGIQGVQGVLCTSSMRIKHIEPHRTFSTYIFAEIARYIQFFYLSSGWIDWTELSLCTSSRRFKHIDPHRTFSNYILKHFEPHRTFSNYIPTELARYIDFFHTTTSSQREEGI